MKIPAKLAAIAIVPTVLLGGFNTASARELYYENLWTTQLMKRQQMAREVMDSNKDGMISKDEYMAFAEKAAGKGFMVTDMNDDGMISEDEWMNPVLYGGNRQIYGGF